VFTEWLEDIVPTLTPRQRTGARWLLAQVGARKQEADAAAMESLSRRFMRAREALEERLPVFRQSHHLAEGVRLAPFAAVLALQVSAHANTLTRRAGRLRNPADDAEAHRTRIAGKRLRYLMEPVAPHVAGGPQAIGQLKALQDTLGAFHDAHVWLASLRGYLERWGAEEAQRLAQVARVGEEATVVKSPGSSRLRVGVLAIAAALRGRAEERFDTFQREWGPDQLVTFQESMDAIARELEGRVRDDVEIERKYLLRSLPTPLTDATVVLIEQGYLPGTRLVERLRHEVTDGGDRWTRTVKVGIGVARTELEEPTTRELFDAMWPLTAGRRVTKRRHCIRHGALTWEIDEFTDRDLVLAEVELRNAAEQPDLPDWLAPLVVREVTGEPEYVNANLAR
jgi:CYTH domain-containing protein